MDKEMTGPFIQETGKQERRIGRKVVNGLLIGAIAVLVLLLVAMVFLSLCFLLLGQEANLEEAMLTCGFGVFAIGLLIIRFGIPLCGIGVCGLLWRKRSEKPKWLRVLLVVVMCVCAVWLLYSIGIVIHNIWFY